MLVEPGEIQLRLGGEEISEALRKREDICVGERHHAFVHRVVPEETRDGGALRDKDEGPLDHIHGDELRAEGRRVVGTMDQENILVHVHVWGTRELYHLGKEDGLDMFVGVENVDAWEKGGILDGG